MQGKLGKSASESVTQVLKCIATGTKSDFQPGTPVVLKTFQKSSATCIHDILAVEREIKALTLLSSHPNVVRYYNTLHGKECVYIAMESYSMDLFEFIGSYKSKIDRQVSSVIIQDILSGLAHLGKIGVCHRDLKPENVLVFLTRTDFIAKVCDFSKCEVFLEKDPVADRRLHDFRGSPGFFAPECLVQESYCGFKADVFSVGCIALELLVSHKVFNEHWMSCYNDLQVEGKKDFVAKIGAGLKAVRAEVQRQFVEPGGPLLLNRRRLTNLAPSRKVSVVQTFVEQALEPRPSKRPSATELLSNTWVGEGKKLQLLDALHNRSDRVYIDVPNVLPSKSDVVRAKVDDDYTVTTPRIASADDEEETSLPVLASALSLQAPELSMPYKKPSKVLCEGGNSNVLPILDISPPLEETDDTHRVDDEIMIAVTPIEMPSPKTSPFNTPIISAATSRATSPVPSTLCQIGAEKEFRSSPSPSSPGESERTDSEGYEEDNDESEEMGSDVIEYKASGPISSIMKKYKTLANDLPSKPSTCSSSSSSSGNIDEGEKDSEAEVNHEKRVDVNVVTRQASTDLDELAVKVHDIERLMRKMSQSAVQTDKAIHGIFGAIEVGLGNTMIKPVLPSYAQPKSQKSRQAKAAPKSSPGKGQPLLHLERVPEKTSRKQIPMTAQNIKVPQARTYNLAQTASGGENVLSPYLTTKPHHTAAAYNPSRGKLSI